MATHDYIISNASGAAVRSDLNNALAAIVSNNSNATEPATTYSYMWWADTTAGQLKLRNAANDGWITIQELDGTMLMEDGAVGTPGLAFASDLDTGFYRPADNQLAIATNGVERVEFGTTEVVFNDGGEDIDFRIEGDTEANLFFVDAGNERVGIGTASPGRDLEVYKDAGQAAIAITASTSGQSSLFFADTADSNIGAITYTHSDDALTFRANDSEAARIDSSGRLLIGTSSQVSATDANSLLQIAGNTSGNAILANNSTGALTSGTSMGAVRFFSQAGGVYEEHGRIQCVADGTCGSGDKPGRIIFQTTADGASSVTEQMKIDKNGKLYSVPTYNNTTGSTTNYMRIGADGQMYRSTSSIAYKTDVEDMNDEYADAILNLRPVWYRSTCEGDNPNHSHWGFIAEEVEQIDPRLCSFKEYEASVDEEGKRVVTPLDTPVVDGVDYASLTPLLLNLVKRQKAQIETLEAKVAALESA